MRTIATTIAAGALLWWGTEGGDRSTALSAALTLGVILITIFIYIKTESKKNN